MGIFANVVMAASNPKSFNFNATLGAEFNSSEHGGGFSKLYFQGNARFMDEMSITAACNYEQGGIPNNNAAVSAYIDLQMDFNAGRFDGNFDVYINAANGAIRGYKDPATNYFGGCEMSFGGDDGWYINLGKPSSRNMLRVGIPGLEPDIEGPGFTFSSYLNIGTQLEPMPDPPANVMAMTGASNFMSNESTRATGRGFAFGASLDIDTGPRTFLIFYAKLKAGIGFDINVQDYGETTCTNTNGPIGINGWYASGQLYGYFEGKIGIKYRWFGKDKEKDIISLGAAAILQAKLPNPFWAKATVGGYYSILGGLFQGECTFNVQLGEACQFEGGNGPDALLSPIYVDISPGTNQFDVSTLAQPEITLGIPLNQEFSQEDSKYEIRLDYVNLKTISGNSLYCSQEIGEDNQSISLSPYYELPANDTLILSVNIKVFKNGEFKSDESREVTFYTGDALKVIPLTNLAGSYPIFEQQNLYKKQRLFANTPYIFGYFALETSMPNLINNRPEGKRLMVKLARRTKDAVPKYYLASAATSTYQYGKRVGFRIHPDDIENGKEYRISLVYREIPAGTGSGISPGGTSQGPNNNNGIVTDEDAGSRNSSESNSSRPYPRPYFPKLVSNGRSDDSRGGGQFYNVAPLEEDILLEYAFRSSNYDTFEEKMDAFMATGDEQQNATWIINETNEGFDEVELSGNSFSDPLLEVKWIPFYNTVNWFRDVNTEFYKKIPYQGVGINRPTGRSKIPTWAVTLEPQSIELNHFNQVSTDVLTFQAELRSYVSRNCTLNLGMSVPEGDEGVELCFEKVEQEYNKLPQWAKDFYDDNIPFPEYKAGDYKGIIKYKLPERPDFNYEFILTR